MSAVWECYTDRGVAQQPHHHPNPLLHYPLKHHQQQHHSTPKHQKLLGGHWDPASPRQLRSSWRGVLGVWRGWGLRRSRMAAGAVQPVGGGRGARHRPFGVHEPALESHQPPAGAALPRSAGESEREREGWWGLRCEMRKGDGGG